MLPFLQNRLFVVHSSDEMDARSMEKALKAVCISHTLPQPMVALAKQRKFLY